MHSFYANCLEVSGVLNDEFEYLLKIEMLKVWPWRVRLIEIWDLTQITIRLGSSMVPTIMFKQIPVISACFRFFLSNSWWVSIWKLCREKSTVISFHLVQHQHLSKRTWFDLNSSSSMKAAIRSFDKSEFNCILGLFTCKSRNSQKYLPIFKK